SRSSRICAHIGISCEQIEFRHVLRLCCRPEERYKSQQTHYNLQVHSSSKWVFYCASARQNARHHVRGALQAGKRRYASSNLCCLKRCEASRESCKEQGV